MPQPAGNPVLTDIKKCLTPPDIKKTRASFIAVQKRVSDTKKIRSTSKFNLSVKRIFLLYLNNCNSRRNTFVLTFAGGHHRIASGYTFRRTVVIEWKILQISI